MSDDAGTPDTADENEHSNREAAFVAGRCDCGHVTYPPHPVCPECGDSQDGRVDLSEREGEVLTWTRATTTPPGVREPNALAIVEFDVDGAAVRALGGTTDAVGIGDRVRPVYVDQLRDPALCVRETKSQRWDGMRFEPID